MAVPQPSQAPQAQVPQAAPAPAAPSAPSLAAGNVAIDPARCQFCNLCAQVCRGGPIQQAEGRLSVSPAAPCYTCGQCLSVCPYQAIAIRGITPDDVIPAPPRYQRATFDQLNALLVARRSTRDYADREIDLPTINKLLDIISTAPMGIPPSRVHITIFSGRDKIKALADQLIDRMRILRHRFEMPRGLIQRMFMSREARGLYKSFLLPAMDMIILEHFKGNDWLFYNAPLAIYFHAGDDAEPADPSIAATYGVLAAESLGLGSCMIGTAGPILLSSRTLRTKYHIPANTRHGLFVVFGHPAVKYPNAIQRHLAHIRFI